MSEPDEPTPINYSARAQWLRAAVLGANDGLISVASIMIGVGAVNRTSRAMLITGLAGLVAGACSMAIGEFVSVYTQYDIEAAQLRRETSTGAAKKGGSSGSSSTLPSPLRAAGASALAFAVGALLPLLAGSFIGSWTARMGAVVAATGVGLGGFGAAGAVLGGARVWSSSARVLVGGWMAMGLSYGVLRLFALALGARVSMSN